MKLEDFYKLPQKKETVKLYHVAYYRKSSESEDKQMASIASQEEVITNLAKQKNLKLIKAFREAKSAKEPGRAEFNKMIKMFNSRNDIKGILCWQLNRLSRNPIDTATVQWLLQKGVIDEVVTPTKTYTEFDSDLVMGLEGAMANRFIRELKVNTKRGLDAKIEQGHAPVLAPPGYKNDVHKRQGERSISPHPVYFKLVRKIFDLALTGNFSIQRLHAEAKKMGIENGAGRPISRTQLYIILRNPFYTGRFIYGKKLYSGAHEPMISDSEFDLLQSILENRSRPRGQKRQFPLTGFIHCGLCNYMITAERHTKKSGLVFDYYKCSQKGRGCLQPYISAAKLEAQFYNFLDKIKLSNKYVAWAVKWLREAEKQDRGVRDARHEALQKQYSETGRKIDTLTDKWLSPRNINHELLTDDEYAEQKRKLFLEKNKITKLLKRTDKGHEVWTDLAIETFKFAAGAQHRWEHGTIEDKKVILSVVGSKLVLADRTLKIKPRKPFFLIKEALSNKNVKSVGVNPKIEPKPRSSIFQHSVLGE